MDTEFLRVLDDDAAGPPRVDLSAVMVEGRRRRRRRHAGQAAIAVVAVGAVLTAVPVGLATVHHRRPAPSAVASPRPTEPTPEPSPTSVTCVLQELPVPAGANRSDVTGMDPTGRYVVGRVYPDGHPKDAVIWHDDLPETVAMPGSLPQLTDVTSAGVAVGGAYNGRTMVPYIYRDGRLTKLAAPAGTTAVAIGDQGTIGGTQEAKPGTDYPIRWATPTSTGTRLPLPSASWHGVVNDVDADGTIIGTISDGPTSILSRVMVWHPDGTTSQLPLPAIAGVNGLVATSIRHGVITGEYLISTPHELDFFPFSYDLATGRFTKLAGWVISGNGTGWVVGVGPFASSASTGLIKLPNLGGKPASDRATKISDDGHTIAGFVSDTNGVDHAVVWRCS
jgi:hypothetical protein